MSQLLRTASLMVAFISMALIALAGLFFMAGARINTSPSIPVGLYWMTKKPIQKGQYVLFCPPQTHKFQSALDRGYINPGFCKGGFGLMMKKVMAVSGDKVVFTKVGVWVNSHLLPQSLPLLKDLQGRALPSLDKTALLLKPNQLLLMTDQNPLSFDARYFGPVEQSQVLAVIRPVLTWESKLNFN